MQWKQLVSAAMACSMLTTAVYAADAAKPAEAQVVAVPNDTVILKVDGEPVTKAVVLEMWNSVFPKGKTPDFDKVQGDVRENLLRGVATERVLMKKANAANIANDPEVVDRLNKLKDKVILQVFLEKEAGARVTDDVVRKRVDEENAKLKDKKQARGSHILVKTKADAEAVIAKLKAGEKFEDLAKKLSLDTVSGKQGGQLGFFGESDMVAEFSKAAFALKPNVVSAPVETTFGWHVIKVSEFRPVPQIKFDEVKDQYREELKSQELEKYVVDLVGKSDIRMVMPDGTEKPIANAAEAANPAK